ncbi:MAG: hypothetical protein OHK0029_41230 [Armatimonadaceae bacterium]
MQRWFKVGSIPGSPTLVRRHGVALFGIALFTVLWCGVCGRPGVASGVMMPRSNSGKKVTPALRQRAMIYFADGQETLVIQPTYQGDPGEFVWLLAVPSRPLYGIQQGALFSELLQAFPEPKEPRIEDGVSVEERTIGAYDVAVLSALDKNAVIDWLNRNGYAVPPGAERPIATYVNKGWVFIGCKIANPATNRGLAQGTLAPLRLRFTAERPIYPLLLSSAQAGSFDLDITLLLPLRESRGAMTGMIALAVQSGPQKLKRSAKLRKSVGNLQPTEKKTPTLYAITRETVRVFQERVRLSGRDCTEDLVWATKIAK